MRQRVEDLGRLAERLDTILENDVWYVYEGKPKNIWDEFQEMDEDKQEEMLEAFAVGLKDLYEALVTCREIANGEDALNEADE